MRREETLGVLAGSTAAPSGPDQGEVIGLPVSVGSMATVTQEIVRLARRGAGAHVCVANVHMLVEARRDPDLRDVLESADLVVSDGMPLVWQLRRNGFAHAQQVRGPELMIRVCEAAAAEGLPVYFYGGDAALMAELRVALQHRIPELRIAGMEAAPMLPRQPQVDQATVERIRGSGARAVFVGLGCPKQEFWMAAYRRELPAVLIGVGQAFGIAAGLLPQAPEWMRRAGLEWLFRLGLEPRRLWRRYLVTNSLFIAFVVGEMASRWLRFSSR